MNFIDLRSDTVTKPSSEMRRVMADAEVGDDVYGEDPTVISLERKAAELIGMEAAVLATSGTQSNLLALLSHCQRGEEYIVGQTAHTYKYEGGGAAVLGSIQPQPLDFRDDGTLDLDQVQGAIKPDDYHFARTKLLCLENTQGGLALPMEYFPKAKDVADRNHLRLHLDGARLFNAAAKYKVEAAEICKVFDSVSICLSKGLGAPVGSVLCGDHELIAQARRWRKMLGGGMRQAGIIAAAGIYALEYNRPRLEEDHEHAELLASGLKQIEGLVVEFEGAQTNMVFVNIPEDSVGKLQHSFADKGVLLPGGRKLRLVTHLDISRKDIERVLELFRNFRY